MSVISSSYATLNTKWVVDVMFALQLLLFADYLGVVAVAANKTEKFTHNFAIYILVDNHCYLLCHEHRTLSPYTVDLTNVIMTQHVILDRQQV